MTRDPTFWLLARAAGLTAYALLTASVLAGLVLKARPLGTRLRPATVADVHRTLALLALGLVGLHGVALVLDSTVEVSPAGLVAPGLVEYRPAWTAAGVLAADLMALVYVSFSLRGHIGARAWHRLHWLTYAVFAGATVHGVAAGSDSGSPWALGLYAGSLGTVVAATAWRTLVPPVTTTRRRPA
jgi:DMSO/TMAO reductase YedYZ heme-binding membrane subunit